jgi:ketosteroid isomerase-like protein
MKRAPYIYAFAAMVLALATACSAKVDLQTATPAASAEATLNSVLEADRNFAAATKKDGLKAAFLAWFEPAGAFIDASGKVTGADKIAGGFAQAPPSFTIDWAPEAGQVSAGGDFASTNGLYTIKVSGVVGEQGRYVSVWRKDAAGAWKVVSQVTVAGRTPPSAPDPQGRPG